MLEAGKQKEDLGLGLVFLFLFSLVLEDVLCVCYLEILFFFFP